MIQKRTIGIVGAGYVGVAAAYAAFLRELASELILIDKNGKKAEGEAIIEDRRAVLPVSVRLNGQYDLDQVCLSIPAVLGNNGVEATIHPNLNTTEIEGLQHSARTLKEQLVGIEL